MKKALFSFVGFYLLIPFVLTYFIYPVAEKEYSGFWYGMITGSVHGYTWLQNLVYSVFDSAHFIKAPNCSGWYSFCFWTSAISVSFLILAQLLLILGLGSLVSFLKKNKENQ
jgi:hypothetical protein